MRLRTPATTTCPDCGAEWNAATAGFCGRCGALLDTRRDRPSATGRSRSPGTTAPAPGRGRVLLYAALVLGLLGAGAVAIGSADPGESTGAVEVPTAAAEIPATPQPQTRPAPRPPPQPTCRSLDGTDCLRWWRAPRSAATAWVRSGTAVLGVDNERAFSVDLAAGTEQWSVRFDERAHIRGATDDTLVLSLGARATVAVDTATGRQLWQAEGRIPVLGSPVLAPAGVVLVARVETPPPGAGSAPVGDVIALDLRDGSQRWRSPAGGGVSPVALQSPDGALLLDLSVRRGDRAVVARVDPATGETLWAVEPPGALAGVVPGGVIVRGGQFPQDPDTRDAARLEVRELATGAVRWAAAVPAEGWVAMAHDRVVTGGESGRDAGPLVARSPVDGAILWESDLQAWVVLPALGRDPSPRWWTAADPGGPLVVLRPDERVSRIDPDDGRPTWTRHDSAVSFGVTTREHVALFRSQDNDDPGGVRLLDADDGRMLFDVAGRFSDVISFAPLIVAGDHGLARIDLPAPSPAG